MFARRQAGGVALAVLLLLLLVTTTVSAAVPTLTVSPASGLPGASVAATGSGFSNTATLAFTWDSNPRVIKRARANGGKFTVTLVIPNVAAGSHTLHVTSGRTTASASVQVASVAPTPTSTPTPTAAPSSTPTATPTVTVVPTQVSGGPMLGQCPVLPADNIWNTRVDTLAASPLSATYISSLGGSTGLHPDFGTVWNGAPNGIPFVQVPGSQARVPMTFGYADESDPGPYPIPTNAPIEGGPTSSGDRHVLAVDSSACTLYELYSAYPNSDGSWNAGSGAVYPLASNALRPPGWTSADAAGLPILPGLVRYDEVAAGQIDHALRFTAAVTQKAYVWPARHYASSNTSTAVPPMGTRLRLKAAVDISHFSHFNQVILTALKTYGMLLADNGSNWFVGGAPDPRWDDTDLGMLRQIIGNNLEVVDTSPLMINPNSGQARQP